MASSKPVAVFLGGGGCLQGFPEIIQFTELILLGVINLEEVKYCGATSVGAVNVWNPFIARKIWKERIHSKNDIICVNPRLQAAYLTLFKNIPVFPWKHKHNSLKELAEDYRLQVWNLVQVIKFIRRAYRSVPNFFLGIENGTQKNLDGQQTFIDYLFELMKFLKIDKEQALFDLNPLMKILDEVLDEKDFLGHKEKIHIMVRSVETGVEHVFSNKEEDLSRGQNYHFIDSKEKGLLATRASISLRTLFDPVVIDGARYCDDGMKNPLPVSYAFDEGCDEIFAFTKDYSLYTSGETIPGAAEEEIDAGLQDRYMVAKRLAEMRANLDIKKLRIIHPTQPIHTDFGLLDISDAAKECDEKMEIEAMLDWSKKYKETA